MSSLTVVLLGSPMSQPTNPTDSLSGFSSSHHLNRPGHRVVRRDRPGAPEERLGLAEDAGAPAAVEREHLVLGGGCEHRAEVVHVRRELRLDALRDQFGHRLDAGRRVARLVVEVRVVERRPTELGDVLRRQVETAAHRLAVERSGAGEGQHGAEVDGLAGAGAGLLDAEQGGQVGGAPAARRAGRAAGRPSRGGCRRAGRRAGGGAGGVGVARAGVVVVVTATGGQERRCADRSGGAEQHPAAGDPPLVHGLPDHVLVAHQCFPLVVGARCRGVSTWLSAGVGLLPHAVARVERLVRGPPWRRRSPGGNVVPPPLRRQGLV